MNTVIKLRVPFLLFVMIAIGNMLQAAEPQKARLRKLLRDHPEVAEKFLKKIAKQPRATQDQPPRQTPVKPKPVVPPKPEVKKPVILPPEPAPKPAPVPTPKPEPVPIPTQAPKPVEKPWITEQERNYIHSILTILETYSARVFIAIESFFSKNNYQPLKTHVASLRAQLSYLQQNLVQKFPQAETPERRALFTQLHNITKAMEQAQILLCNTVDKQYSPSALGAVKLGNEFSKIAAPLDRQQAIANQNSIALRKALLVGKIPDTAARVGRLQVNLNKIFDYGKGNTMAILSGVTHRLRQK